MHTAGTDVDHVIPASLGGSDEDSNLTLLCRWCHDH
ncbi:HNH endonuclease [Streptomyces javensis]